MKVLGIIAEYNPFHNGHKYQLEQGKEKSEAEYTVAVMSGNFVQRGEPACFDKWTRATSAVKCGVDLVLELPTDFAVASAERFAFGGVSLLNSLGVVTHISFGAESDSEHLLKASDILSEETSEFKERLKKNLSEGVAFPVARQRALGDELSLTLPNDILATEYLKALKKLKSKIIPVPVLRYMCHHNDEAPNGEFASASAIRNMLKEGTDAKKYIPDEALCCFEGKTPLFLQDFYELLQYSIITQSPERLARYGEIREGLENRILKSAYGENSAETLIEQIKSKRYTKTAISRMLFQTLLKIKKENLAKAPKFCRVLAFNEKGAELLHRIKDASSLPIITKTADADLTDMESRLELETDLFASDVYSIISGNKKGRVDLTTSPVFIK